MQIDGIKTSIIIILSSSLFTGVKSRGAGGAVDGHYLESQHLPVLEFSGKVV